MIEALADAVLALGPDAAIRFANRSVTRLTGYAVDELVGQPCSVLHPRGKDGRALLHGGWHRSTVLPSVVRIPEQEVLLRRADGTDTRAHLTGTYQRSAGGAVEGVTVSLRPVGGRGLQSVTGMEIVSTVSHELRAPLTSVKGYTSLLLSRWDRLADDQKRTMLGQVNHDADRVTRLITELLDISRLESGRLVLRRQLVDLEKVTLSVLEKVKMEYPDLDCEVAFPHPFPVVWADADKVEQVLTNLVENACKYASPSGMTLEGRVAEGEVAVAVHDRGEGFPEHDLAKVFTKFFRRAETRPSGSGLGLWISRGLVEAHGGRLEATSVPGHGSTFRFTLPLAEADGAGVP
ncbi:MAG TPA: ATP-binding protein [Acidimicrobiales bacterium]|nr:ATP-binding protein [Acidimicrobiales bacterium]